MSRISNRLYFMFRTLGLALPALIPSWNFFDVIAPSPRIEFAHTETEDQSTSLWQPFRPRPQHVSMLTMLRRMVWNPHWNETLYTMSLSERLIANPTDHSEDAILTRIADDIRAHAPEAEGYIRFRLVFIYREGDTLDQEILFESKAQAIKATA